MLVAFRAQADSDAVTGALALFLFLEKIKKNADLVSAGFKLPEKLGFLPKKEKISSSVSHLKKFVISIDTTLTGLEQLSYDLVNNELKIFITPKTGYLQNENLKAAQTDFKYDLILTVGSPDLDSLGSLYSNNRELFYKVPIINIDNSASNERYGQINIVDTSATAISQIIFQIIKDLGEEYLDQNIATTLFCGLMEKTGGLKTKNINPQALLSAGKLLGYGADKETVVKYLYHNRSLSTLKIWGRTLARLKSFDTGLVFSSLTRDDFLRSSSNPEDLPDIIDEIIISCPEARVILILYECLEKGELKGILRATDETNISNLIPEYKLYGGEQNAFFTVPDISLPEAEKILTEKINAKLVKNKS